MDTLESNILQTPHGILVPKSFKKLIKKLDTEFTVWSSTKYSGGPKRVEIFYIIPGYHVYPLFGFNSENIKEVNDLEPEYNFNSAAIVNKDFSFSNYQMKIVRAAEARLNGTYGGMIIKAQCGIGKTLLAIHLIFYRKIKAAIIVPRSDFIRQWNTELNLYFSVPPSTTTSVDNDSADILFITGSMLTTILKDGRIKKIYNRRMLVLDEVHHFGADGLNRAMSSMRYNYCIGLTATPERLDGLEKIYYPFVGKPIEIKYLETELRGNNIISWIITAKSIKIDTNTIMRGKNEVVNYSEIISNLSDNTKYSKIINSVVSALIKINKNRHILVLSDRINQLIHLYDECDIDNKSLYTGSYKKGIIKKESMYNVIYASYGIANEGFNVPAINAIILASPRASWIEQIIGRATRKHHDIPVLLIDIIPDNGVLFNQRRLKRIPEYKRLGFKIEYKSNDDEIDYYDPYWY